MNQNNRKAFLDMLASSEGTKGKGFDGYNVIVGGELFNDFSDHPRKKVFIKRINDFSTAAGRYQLLARYWDAYRRTLKLTDFSPPSQDAVALQQIKERGALNDIDEGRIEAAIRKCRNIWASLPGAGYGQHEQKLEFLLAAYDNAGGTRVA